jgi:hypothetical protein
MQDEDDAHPVLDQTSDDPGAPQGSGTIQRGDDRLDRGGH